MKAELVTHFIAGYPMRKPVSRWQEVLPREAPPTWRCRYPFPIPAPTVPVIENACRLALEKGYKVDQAMEMLSTLSGELDIPVS